MGWTCPQAGARCIPRCGDGTCSRTRPATTATTSSGDGCSDDLPLGTGLRLPDAGDCSAIRTICGDGVREGASRCDDGNSYGGDGCGADCRAEPVCTGTSGCASPAATASSCRTRTATTATSPRATGAAPTARSSRGGTARTSATATTDTCVVPVVYRDFMNRGATGRAPELRARASRARVVTGMVQPTLGSGSQAADGGLHRPRTRRLTTAANFDQWYHDSPLGKTGARHDDPRCASRTARSSSITRRFGATPRPVGWITPPFFPVDDRGLGPTARRARDRLPGRLLSRITSSTTTASPARCATGSSTRAARRWTSSVTTTCGCSSTASSPSISAACTAPRAGSVTLDATDATPSGSRRARSTRSPCSRRSARLAAPPTS